MTYLYNKFYNWVQNQSFWLKIILPLIMTVSGIFLNYDISFIQNDHPHLFVFFHDYVLPQMLYILIFSTIFYTYTLFVENKNQPTIIELKEKLNAAEDKNKFISERLKDLFDGYLYNLAFKLEFGKRGINCERITLFIHDGNKSLTPFSRYSANPKYGKINRTIYPDHEGCIAKAWENGWHFDASFPCPKKDNKKYLDYNLNTYSIQKSTSKQLSMTSRIYAAHRIEISGNPLAIIVVESETENRFEEKFVKDTLKSQNEFLSQIIKELYEYIPRPNTASSRGL